MIFRPEHRLAAVPNQERVVYSPTSNSYENFDFDEDSFLALLKYVKAQLPA